MLDNKEIDLESKHIVHEAYQTGIMDYDKYIGLLRKLDHRQIKNIIINCHTRLDKTIPELPSSWPPPVLAEKAKELLERAPEFVHHLFGCPLIVFRAEEFLDFLSKKKSLSELSDTRLFWEFVETFPQKEYYRAIRVRKGQDISFYTGMLTAPNLEYKFLDSDDSTYPPIIGDFEESFTYHVYNRSTNKSMVSWSENKMVSLTASTEDSDEYDRDWFLDEAGKVMVVKVKGNSFFFLDETVINKSSRKPIGYEVVLLMSLPLSAIEKGGISFEILNKKQLATQLNQKRLR